jgi:hypothetical protein
MERMQSVLDEFPGEKTYHEEDGLTEAELQFEEEVKYIDGTDIRDKIYEKMCSLQIPLVELHFNKPTLEQVFMMLTSEDE